MKLENNRILLINKTLNEIRQQKIKGTVKFKLLKAAKELSLVIEPIIKSLENVEDEKEIQEILEIEQEINLPILYEEELEDMELSLEQLVVLENLFEKENEDE